VRAQARRLDHGIDLNVDRGGARAGELRQVERSGVVQGQQLGGVDRRRAEREPLELGCEMPEGEAVAGRQAAVGEALDDRRVRAYF
jgi:hypothetical protein